MNALWKYVHLDESDEKPSWKYLGLLVRNMDDTKKVIWIRNPHFAYEHLSPYDDDSISQKGN